ncbi:MAG: fumarylacetoacetate hydrolase family protein [Chloroflexota bacterium]|nr:fumarylacetoacetate hydrolase family protein [Chloroflexota bacterium]
MKLISYRTRRAFAGEPGRSDRLGVLLGDLVVPTAVLGEDAPGSMAQLLASGPASVDRLRRLVDVGAAWAYAEEGLPIDSVELLPPVPRPGKIVAVGVNYRSHAEEQNREPPASPVIFAKFPSAVVAHGVDVCWDPQLTQAVDFEAELAVVIGRTARHVDEAAGLDHVLGYACLNDVSARDLQYADRQFTRAKSLDTFCPLGPALVTADEVGDPQALAIRSFVNGELMQSASTAEMIFGVARLVSFCSAAFSLDPGDVIATGTPAGVGWFREPRRMLRDGDEVVIEIERVGRLVNRCREVAA